MAFHCVANGEEGYFVLHFTEPTFIFALITPERSRRILLSASTGIGAGTFRLE